MIQAVLSGFVLALFAPWIHKYGRSAAGWIIALLPLGIVLYFISLIDGVAHHGALELAYTWVPSMGIDMTFYVDGLSLTFAMLISGIGTLIIIYAGGYLHGHDQLGMMYAYLLAFMASMLGVVTAGNLITLFIFWELTSVTSFLLIGFNHNKQASRNAAMQALLVTGGGGLLMLIGFLMLGATVGSYDMATLLHQGDLVRESALYLPIFILVLLGAATKSAQFPFHFWLPGAMEAPTPVSAYLHSATMVKAGIFLLARLLPVLNGTEVWFYTVTLLGMTTMVVGAVLALVKRDLKRILAYSTISSLGTLVMLLGLDTEIAVEAMVVFLMVHSFYKGGLFMVAGTIDHEMGTRDITLLGGLRKVMPFITVGAILTALSMAGIPGFLGFVGKELVYEADLHSLNWPWVWAIMAVVSNMSMVAVAVMMGYEIFFGKRKETPKAGHRAPVSMWLGPVLLGSFGLIFGLLPMLLDTLVGAGVAGILQEGESHVHLAIWHGFKIELVLSAITVAGGLGFFALRGYFRRDMATASEAISQYGPEKLYRQSLVWLDASARWLTRLIQNGNLRWYVFASVSAVALFILYGLVSEQIIYIPPLQVEISIYELVITVVILLATIFAVISRSRLAAVISLSVVSFGMVLYYIWFSAPDLAMTEISIGTLTLILFVLVVARLPRFRAKTSNAVALRDALVAGLFGLLIAFFVVFITSQPLESRMAYYFAENSYTLAHGHNVVNVILVDFRGFDTMGEITVLAVAAIGVLGLIRLGRRMDSAESKG